MRTGAATSVNTVTENNTTMTLATQKGIDMSFTSVDMTMSVDEFSKRYLGPAVNKLAGYVAVDVMSSSEGGVSNCVDNGSGGVIVTPTASTILQANAILDIFSANTVDRMIVTDPQTDARVVSALSGLFNPSQAVSKQYRTGAMRNALGFDWLRDQTVIKHTTGTFSSGTMNGASQTGTTLVVNAITGTLNQGDIITIAGVHSVNRITNQSNGTLAQFVVLRTWRAARPRSRFTARSSPAPCSIRPWTCLRPIPRRSLSSTRLRACSARTSLSRRAP